MRKEVEMKDKTRVMEVETVRHGQQSIFRRRKCRRKSRCVGSSLPDFVAEATSKKSEFKTILPVTSVLRHLYGDKWLRFRTGAGKSYFVDVADRRAYKGNRS